MSSLPPPEATARWYEEKVRTYGFDYRGLGFRTRSSQVKRFEALMALGELDGRRVLDVGCGFGDFLEFLHGQGVRPVYTGIDVCEPMVRRCIERFGKDARFEATDVLEYEPTETFDYVVASGLFGLDAEGTRERILPSLERMVRWARIGAAVNFLSAAYPNPAENRIYVEPGKAIEAALTLAPAVRLDHTYLPNDFTLYLYRSPLWASDSEARTA
jgi:SAM-dependent methyltransferase